MSNENTTRAADEAAIRDLFGALRDDWDRGDGEAYGSRFTGDGDYVVFDGSHLKGPEEIGSSHQQLFDTWLKGSRLLGQIEDPRFLSDEVALPHATGVVLCSPARPSPHPRRSRSS